MKEERDADKGYDEDEEGEEAGYYEEEEGDYDEDEGRWGYGLEGRLRVYIYICPHTHTPALRVEWP